MRQNSSSVMKSIVDMTIKAILCSKQHTIDSCVSEKKSEKLCWDIHSLHCSHSF